MVSFLTMTECRLRVTQKWQASRGQSLLPWGIRPDPGAPRALKELQATLPHFAFPEKWKRGFQFSRQIPGEELYVSFSTVDRVLTVICHRVPQDFSHRPWLIKAVVRVWIRYNFELCARDDTRTFRFDAFSWRGPIIFLSDKDNCRRLINVANSPEQFSTIRIVGSNRAKVVDRPSLSAEEGGAPAIA